MRVIAGVSPLAGDHRLATSVVSRSSPSWVGRFWVSNETGHGRSSEACYGDREPVGLFMLGMNVSPMAPGPAQSHQCLEGML